MTLESIQAWIDQNPAQSTWLIIVALLVFGVIGYLIARYLIARGLVYLAQRTKNKYDDIVVDKLRPFRFAWIAPLLVIYFFAGLLPMQAHIVQQIVLFLILWLGIITINSLLNAVNAIYEASPLYHGEPIQGYLDLGKVIMIIVGVILSISMFSGQSPWVLLSGLGAIMAILLLIFRDTILSFVASVQIQSSDLVLEGDAVEIPSYGADGEVQNISLYSVRIQNWDKSITMVPTYKLVEVPYKNWRGMFESGGRRIKRSIYIDQNSIKFCDHELLAHLARIELIKDYVQAKLTAPESEIAGDDEAIQDPIGGQRLTNIEIFRRYVISYLKFREDLHQQELTLLVRQLAPSPAGLPIEIYVFTTTTEWKAYEDIQADIFGHLIAALPQFDLRMFQEPTGLDFQAFLEAK